MATPEMFDSLSGEIREISPSIVRTRISYMNDARLWGVRQTLTRMDRLSVASTSNKTVEGILQTIDSFGLSWDGTIQGGIGAVGLFTSSVAENVNALNKVGDLWREGRRLARKDIKTAVISGSIGRLPSDEELDNLKDSPIVTIVEDLASVPSRALVWAGFSNYPGFKDKNNISWYELELAALGAVSIGSNLVARLGQEPVVKHTVHYVLFEGKPVTRLACWSMGEEQVDYAHGWNEDCIAAVPARPIPQLKTY